MPEAIVLAWKVYSSTRDENAKILLIEHYQPLVKNIMRPFWSKKPFLLDMDDLKQAGNIGLIQAIERYNPDSNASFETFAQLRVKGAMLDEINSLDWTPRNIRRQIREVLDAENKIAASGREITVENLADFTGYTHTEIERARASSRRTFILPVDQEAIREMENSPTSKSEDNGSFDPLDGSGKDNDGLDFRLSLMQELTEDERQVVYLKFFCGETMSRISELTGLPLTKVSMLNKSALGKIKIVYLREATD